MKPVLPANSLADSLQKADKAVVYIVTEDAIGNRTASGSGFVISKDGLVATNHHVMSLAVRAHIQFRDGSKHDIVGYRGFDSDHDLAIIQIKDPPDNLAFYDLRVPDNLRQGEDLTAIGHPSDFMFTVTTGIVSAVRRSSELPKQYRQFLAAPAEATWIQTNAAISGGNSGGPLLNRSGDVVGLNTWIAGGQNLGFAIHVKHLIDLQQKLESQPQALPLPDLGLIVDPKIAAIMQDFGKEAQVFVNKLTQVSSQAEARKVMESHDPSPLYLSRLLSIANENASRETRREALMQACKMIRQQGNTSAAAREVIRKLDEFVQDRHITEAALGLASGDSKEAIAFLQKLAQESPHHAVKGTACYCLAVVLGKKAMQNRAEMVALLERCTNEFGDVRIRRQPIREVAQPLLTEWKYLAAGCLAQDIKGKDIQGQEFSLAEHRGKVVLLDFWVDWCPYCREMYPHTRELLEKLKDQPFVVLGVNSDTKDRAEHVMNQGNVTWRSWYDGQEGPILKAWNVTSFPTTYLIDKKGRIRYKNLNEPEALSQAVKALMDESDFELPGNLVPATKPWKYRDDGSSPGAQWTSIEFDDSSWKQGVGIIGYGVGDETTTLSATPNGTHKPSTAFFRTTFEVADPTAIRDLQLTIGYDDGMAAYVNGQEIARFNLSPGADHAQFAVAAAKGMMGNRELVGIDPKLLRPGLNVLSVEVHQESAWSADFRFEATLSSNQMARLAAEAENNDSPHQLRAVGMLGQLESFAKPYVPALIKAVNAKQEQTGLEAQFALIRISPDRAKEFPVPPPKKFASYEARKLLASQMNGLAWDVVLSPHRSEADYRLAYTRVLWATLLHSKDAATMNTLGLASHRVGKHREALNALRESTQLHGKNPCDLIVAAMAQLEMSQRDKAQAIADQAASLLKDPKFVDEAETKQLMDEFQAKLAAK
jgi:S1-C subfamily serine protease/peroxiredoxin/Flp pilus assembly protein TadD